MPRPNTLGQAGAHEVYVRVLARSINGGPQVTISLVGLAIEYGNSIALASPISRSELTLFGLTPLEPGIPDVFRIEATWAVRPVSKIKKLAQAIKTSTSQKLAIRYPTERIVHTKLSARA